MKLNFTLAICLIALTLLNSSRAVAGGEHVHGDVDEHAEIVKGPHGGRLLKQERLELEITLFEHGVPPQFRVFAYVDGTLIDPKDVEINIELMRFGAKVDAFELKPQNDYSTSPKEVSEPHSFEVNVSAKFGGEQYEWEYDSFEGRTELSESAIKAANIEVEEVGSQLIEHWVKAYGNLIPREDRVAHITPRFSGIIREVRKGLGDPVKKNEVLAVVESNQGLQAYEVKSQISGIVVAQHATLGEFVSDSAQIFIVADLEELWAEFQIYRDEFDQLAVGQKVRVFTGNSSAPLDSVISYISPLIDEATQSKVIRAKVKNETMVLRPGLFITGEVALAAQDVPLAVKRSALQTFRDWNVIFLTDGNVFQAMPIELGRKSNEYIEVISGLEGGEKYVSENSFIIKADIEKSGASHDH